MAIMFSGHQTFKNVLPHLLGVQKANTYNCIGYL